MTTKTLLGIVAGVFIIFIGAYIVLSPADNRTVDTTVSESTSADITVIPSAPTQTEGATTEAVVPDPTTAPSPTSTAQPTTATSYTTAEVAIHNNQSSCWTIVNGTVYDLTSFISKHPGGAKRILSICGIDGTAAFTRQHSGDERPQETITGYEIGIIK